MGKGSVNKRKQKNNNNIPNKAKRISVESNQQQKFVDSLLDSMVDGNEYGSIVSLNPKNPDLNSELRRALKDIEDIRKRPCLCYIANVVNPGPISGIMDNDDLPFNEMVSKVDPNIKNVDVLIVTNGGSAQQVAQFVDTLRPRFDSVEYILPYKCMSAGTLWVLSGDKIWMDERAFIGPIDPQERMLDGSFVPCQALMGLVKQFKEEWEVLKKNGKNPPLAQVRILDNIDPRRIGNAMALTNYVTSMASDFLYEFKFKDWKTHSKTGGSVTEQDKKTRADEIAQSLASNEQWKSHGHGLSREVVENELRVKIDRLESNKPLERAVRRFWALIYWVFDRSATAKLTISQDYVLIRNNPQVIKR